MKQSEYIPISVREKIEDKNIAKVCDYLERHSKEFWYLKVSETVEQLDVGRYNFDFIWNCTKVYDGKLQDKFYWPTKLLADNIVWIWGSLKNL